MYPFPEPKTQLTLQSSPMTSPPARQLSSNLSFAPTLLAKPSHSKYGANFKIRLSAVPSFVSSPRNTSQSSMMTSRTADSRMLPGNTVKPKSKRPLGDSTNTVHSFARMLMFEIFFSTCSCVFQLNQQPAIKKPKSVNMSSKVDFICG